MIELANTTQGLSTKCWKLIGAKPPGNLDNETKIELSSLQKIQRETIATKMLKNEKQKKDSSLFTSLVSNIFYHF